METERRLIDADLLWQEVRDDADITGRAYQAVKEHILGAKTVDAVEVVRCNHCRNKEDIPYPKGQVWCRKMASVRKG
jgi:hypothetical protein